MQELIEFMAKNLVDNPEAVSVTEERQRGRIVLRLQVGEDDFGRVIGRNGRIAQAMRSLLKVSAVRHHEYASLEIGD